MPPEHTRASPRVFRELSQQSQILVNHVPEAERAYRREEEHTRSWGWAGAFEQDTAEIQAEIRERGRQNNEDGCIGFEPPGDPPEPGFNETSPYGLVQFDRFLTPIQSLGGRWAVVTPLASEAPRPRKG